ncbi:MAG TPA: hypothetical protein VER96_09305 [Polyangiaceae bacterium]|nr:hypothetical protein [Polyangiaceae bacterium]
MGRIVSVLLLCVGVVVACSTSSDHPPPVQGSSQEPPMFGPSSGAECEEEGAVVPCGHVTNTYGDYVTCSMGEVTCHDGRWGACVGDHLVTMSHPNVRLTQTGLHVLSTPVPCTNVCDPYCTSRQNDPTDVVDASSIVPNADGGGVTLQKADGGVTVKASNNCRGLQCQLVTCTGMGVTTTISGTVYDPAGNNPMYNANVYIPVMPKEALPAFGTGASCDTCAGAPALVALRSARTDSSGNFTLSDVPVGANIPIVVQMGKWRREIVLKTVASCTGNAVTNNCTASSAADCVFRLPKNQKDGYDPVAGTYTKADVPKLAIVSGSADPFDCLLLKAGLDPAEFGDNTSSKRFHFYQSDSSPGNKLSSTYGANVTGASLWNNLSGAGSNLMSYDVVLLPCEGGNYDKQTTGNTPYQNLISYADAGGRAFATHFSYTWLQYPSVKGYVAAPNDWSKVAKWTHSSGTTNTQDPMTAVVDTSFPKGSVYSTWLQNVAATATPTRLTVHEGRQDLTTVGTDTQSWMSAYDTKYLTAPTYSPLFTFNTPYAAGSANQCGRVVYSDFHVSANALVGANQCLSNADCGYTATCVGAKPGGQGQCTEPCDTPADCPATSYSCNGAAVGKCQLKGCTSASDCPTGETCNNGTCSCSAATGSTECSGTCDGMTCKSGHACTSNAGCGLGTCGGGTCTKSGTNAAGACHKNTDCGLGTCGGGSNNGTCTAGTACHVDADCGASGTCGSGTSATIGNCSTNAAICHSAAQCDSGSCAGGTCNTNGASCHLNANCDSGACGSGTGTAGTCSTSGIACHSSLTCDGGSCAGGTCNTGTTTVCHKNADCDNGICGATKGTCSVRVCTGGSKAGTICTSNATCTGGTCAATAACSVDTDCAGTGAVCNNVKCSGTKACGDDLSCGASKLCNSAKCATVSCAGDTACSLTKLCNGATCATASCTGDSTCGVSKLCNNAKCAASTCAGDSGCSVSKLCNGAKCNAATCANDAQCPTGVLCNNAKCTNPATCGSKADCGTSSSNVCSNSFCTTNACSTNADCGSGGTCGGGVCSTGDDCVGPAGCGSEESCNGYAQGLCAKSCTKDADCAPDLCVNGKCGGCTNSAQCNDNAYTPSCGGIAAANYGKCSVYTTGQFPAACRQGQLSPQEKALEFMFFDLTACVSSDDLPPPGPAVLPGYNPATFVQDYTANCTDGMKPVWREFDWQASIPDTASIVMTAQSGDTIATLSPAMPLALATATTSTNIGSSGTNFDFALIDTGKGATTAGVFNKASPVVPSRNVLRLTITLNPTGDNLVAPALLKWKVQYDCAPGE